ncbi:MAG: sigma-70 family RNA polymerase sigma factor [Thermoflexus hugenholtzii]|jgi:RNA polymerase sigma-70 factor (ECF subfamily)|uniref:RNA polymerase sigma factor n=1 Tax=Thermoflexus TaxID=1495649 RepID=UPI001C73FE82|nr:MULTISPECIES: sigma-70 family RNA polymerase sigma factor [Thermoflexus]QWK09942.1 MAG: sigma-70 family RNA polymerase sigma factor [Thermoflexus hugenholtzii]
MGLLTPHPEERRWIARARKGDPEAIAALYQHYADGVYRYLLYRVGDAELAEDLTADVFLKMIEDLPRYEERGLPFGAWLFRIARARLIDHWRRQGRRPLVALEDTETGPQISQDIPEDEIAVSEMIQRALRVLTEEQREVVVLRFLVGMSLEEVARAMGKSVGAVKALQHRALSALARYLEKIR